MQMWRIKRDKRAGLLKFPTYHAVLAVKATRAERGRAYARP
jgi:hypothetical protein